MSVSLAKTPAITARSAKPPRYPYSLEIEYARNLKRFVREIKSFAIEEIKLHGDDLILQADRTYLRADRAIGVFGIGSLLNDTLDRISIRANAALNLISNFVGEIAAKVNFFHDRDFARQAREAYGRNVNSNNQNPGLRSAQSPLPNSARTDLTLAGVISAWEQNNLTLIQSIPTTILDQLRFQFAKAFAAGTTLRQLIEIIEDRSSVGEIRAALIARDQIGSLNGQLSEIRQKAAGIDSYVWRTMQDERVRQTHRVRDYKTYKWSDPGIRPGSEINCRCVASPVFPDYDLLIK